MTGLRLLVIGGTRFFGPAILRRALDHGHDVLVYHRGSLDPLRDRDVPHVHGSTLDIADHLSEIIKFRPDAAIDTTQFRADTTTAVVDALKDVCARYVLVSSGDVYRAYGVLHGTEPGGLQEMPVDESAELRTRASFDQTAEVDKIFAERAGLEQDLLPTTVVRAPATFGPGDPQERIAGPMKRLQAAGDRLVLAAKIAGWWFTHGYVDNIADALILCTEDRRPGNFTYNVGYEDDFTVLRRFQFVAEALSWEGEITTSPEVAPQENANFTQDLVMDTSLIRRELGYGEVVPLAEAVRRSVIWEAEAAS